MTVFHQSPPPWFEEVKDLRPGQGRRISESVKVSFNGKGYAHWDFREKVLEVYEPELSLAEKLALIALQREAQDEATSSAQPPLPAQPHPQDWPAAARVWMHKAHFNNTDIMVTGAYWNARLGRVVLPYTNLDGQESWIGRDVSHKPQLKYLFPTGVRRGGGAIVRSILGSPSPLVVITEDLLSAYRVSWAAGVDAIAAQGTSLDRDALVAIATTYDEVDVWLDPDKYGQMGALKIRGDLERLGAKANLVHSTVDPKLLDNAAINEVLTA